MKKVADVAAYIESHNEWREVLEVLRTIIQETELVETIKWGAPVYTIGGKNVVGLGAFKQYAGLWFFNGALLADKKQKLINAQEGKTKALRQWRLSGMADVDKQLIRAYLNEAIDLEKSGKRVKKAKPVTQVDIPTELQAAFAKDNQLAESFAAFTPYKQKEFAEHIASAKREATRLNRLEKCIPLIHDGVGLHDKYRNC